MLVVLFAAMLAKLGTPAWGITIPRIMMGIIVIVAGSQKILGGQLGRFNTGPYVPLGPLWAWWIPLQELIGGILLVLGLGTRFVALFFVGEFVTTGLYLKLSIPLSTPPVGVAGAGWESARIDMMMLTTALALVIAGAGEFSIDRLIREWRKRRAPG